MDDNFAINKINLTKYLFFTGKGGVGKTSTACSIAVNLADEGKKILLISTDPASNLQDVFQTPLTGTGIKIKEVPNLVVANLNPEEAAATYKESVIAPYRGKLPEAVLENMAEQLSGSCTVEIAAFNEFTNFITDKLAQTEYDHIIFDTAPTGHTLRMLQLPSAWSNFISESTHGASCLGQLAGLDDKKEMYKEAVKTLADSDKTTLILVTRPEFAPLKEAERASQELRELGVDNQILVINGLLRNELVSDNISRQFYNKQKKALDEMPPGLRKLEKYTVPLRSYNIEGINSIRNLLKNDDINENTKEIIIPEMLKLQDLIQDLSKQNKKVIFTMGKGGVGKTTLAAAIALGLAEKGAKVHLTTTDPADHLDFVIAQSDNVTISKIDEEVELNKYKEEVLKTAKDSMSDNDIAYIEEDLRSPCTQEIALFRAFAEIVEKADNEIVVIDTAPTGHTLLLLDATESYHKEIQRSQGNVPESVKKLLPRLRNKNETEVVIVTLPETTPVFEALRLQEDLKRAGINNKWWIINSSLLLTETDNVFLKAKAQTEITWINKVKEFAEDNVVVVPWQGAEIKEENIRNLIN